MKSKTCIIDCDGVLTDGKVYYEHDGHRIKGFHSRDIRAIRELTAQGIDVIIITQSTWPGVDNFCERTGAVVVMSRDKSHEALHAYLKEPYIAIGDDVPDIEILRGANRAYCPADADPAVKALDNITILGTKGGDGVIADLVNILSKS